MRAEHNGESVAYNGVLFGVKWYIVCVLIPGVSRRGAYEERVKPTDVYGMGKGRLRRREGENWEMMKSVYGFKPEFRRHPQ